MTQPVRSEKASPSHSNNFDILRVVFAVLVLLSHSYAICTGSDLNEPLYVLTRHRTTFGALAVDGFFILSGFLVTQSWLRSKSLLDFLRRRVRRIYPGFIAVAIFCAVIIGPLGADNPAAYWHALHPLKSVGKALVLLGPSLPPTLQHVPIAVESNGIRVGEINGSLWTIRYEFLCYFFVALLGLLGVYRRQNAVLGLSVVVYLIYCVQEILSPGIGRGTGPTPAPPGLFHWKSLPVIGLLDYWPRLLACFLMGMLFLMYQEKIPRSPRWAVGACVLLALTWFWGLTLVLPLCFAYLLFYVAFSPRLVGQWLTRRADLSYGIYLYAFPIQQLLLQKLGGHLSPLMLFLLATPPTLLLAALSWQFVESPFLKRKRPA